MVGFVYNKPAISIEEQIRKIRERGLSIQNEDDVEIKLSQIGYYRLMGYAYPFDSSDELYFEDIVKIYEFDNVLRLDVFKAIRSIEIALKTKIINCYSVKYGSHWLTNEDLFYNREHFDQTLQNISNQVHRSQARFIKKYLEVYHEPEMPPAWMVLEIIGFGTLSKIFKNLRRQGRKIDIAEEFGVSEPRILANWLQSLSVVRNICAHHARLWNENLNTIMLLNKNKQGLNEYERKSIEPTKLYAFLCCLVHMLDSSVGGDDFKNAIKKLMTEAKNDGLPINQNEMMGFLPDWQEHDLWR